MKKGICAVLMLMITLVLLTGCASIGAGKNDAALKSANENLDKAEAALANGELDQAFSYANEAQKFYDKIEVYSYDDPALDSKRKLLERYNNFRKKFEIAAENKEASDKLNSDLAAPANENDFRVGLTQDSKGVVIIGYIGGNTVGPREPTIVSDFGGGRSGQVAVNRKGIRIPNTIQGMPVKEIRMFANNNDNIGAVILPEGLITIGAGAFKDCKNLQTVIIQSCVTIGESAFEGGKTHLTITLPKNLETIGKNAFATIRGRTNMGGDKGFIYDDVRITIDFPDSLTEIGEGAFKEREFTSSVTLPAGLKTIGKEAFANGRLETVVISGGATQIGESAFSRSGLGSVTLPEGITEIAKSAFSNCGLANVTLPSTLKYIGAGAFYDCGIKNLTLPSTVEVIRAEAFSRNRNLTSVTLSSSMRVIEADAFKDCSSLTTVTIPETVGSIRFIDNNAFRGCTKLNLASQAELKRVGYTGSF